MRALGLGFVFLGLVLVACGGDSSTDFGTGGTGAKSSGGTTAKGGSGGKGGATTGGTGGSSASGGSSTGGTAGDGGSSTGGASGSGGAGGVGGSTGGVGGIETGGTGGGTGGGETGGGTGGGGTGGGGTCGGGTGGGGTGGGGTGGGATDGGTSCQQLASDYLTALAAAKACNPILAVLQCTKVVEDELPCPCSTYVNPGNTEALAKLDALKAQWAAQNCQFGVICPAVLCKEPTGAVCQGSAQGSGSCKDV